MLEVSLRPAPDRRPLPPAVAAAAAQMMTFLANTEHEGFLEWLVKNKYHAKAADEGGGHFVYHEEFKKLDVDHSSTMEEPELREAVHMWMEAGSPGLSQPKAEVKHERKLSDKERIALAFRIEGPPAVVLPPPPRMKKSRYSQPYKVKPSPETMHRKTNFNDTGCAK